MFFSLGLPKKKKKKPHTQKWRTPASTGEESQLPHLFIAFPSQRHLFFTPVGSFFLVLFVRGWCELLVYLLCDQLRNGAWFSERDKKGTMKCVTQCDHKGELDGFTMARLEDQLPSPFSVYSTLTSPALRIVQQWTMLMLLIGGKTKICLFDIL